MLSPDLIAMLLAILMVIALLAEETMAPPVVYGAPYAKRGNNNNNNVYGYNNQNGQRKPSKNAEQDMQKRETRRQVKAAHAPMGQVLQAMEDNMVQGIRKQIQEILNDQEEMLKMIDQKLRYANKVLVEEEHRMKQKTANQNERMMLDRKLEQRLKQMNQEFDAMTRSQKRESQRWKEMEQLSIKNVRKTLGCLRTITKKYVELVINAGKGEEIKGNKIEDLPPTYVAFGH